MEKNHLHFGRLAALIAVLAAVGLAAAYLIGSLLAGDTQRVLREPQALRYPIGPYFAGRQASATPEKQSALLAEGESVSSDNIASLSNESIGWGQGVEVNDLNQPTGALAGQEKYGAYGGYFIFPNAGKTVYLTFDLGYENGYTASILDALKAKGVHGVFFVTMDYVKSAPELVQRILDEGHILGNHSVTHPSLPSCSTEQAENEVMELHSYIKQTYGYDMTLFRFPRGEFSPQRMAQVKALGYTSVFWSYAYVDWKTDAQPDVSASLKKLADAAHPGAIYLLHTVSSTNAALMGDFLEVLTAKGYTIGEMPH